jgi:hypothetical protein
MNDTLLPDYYFHHERIQVLYEERIIDAAKDLDDLSHLSSCSTISFLVLPN